MFLICYYLSSQASQVHAWQSAVNTVNLTTTSSNNSGDTENKVEQLYI